MRSWVEFWDAEHAIYVNHRHKAAHARTVQAGIVQLLPDTPARILDFGCGEAIYAETLAAHCASLMLCEAADRVRERLRQRIGADDRIKVVSPEQLFELDVGTGFDLIMVNSVVQYLSRTQLDALLVQWRSLLATEGRLIIADVVPPDLGKVSDAAALLRFAAREGFLLGAGVGLLRTALSKYGAVRAELGFSVYTEAAFLEVLRSQGFRATRLRPNVGHNQRRLAFEARRTS